MTKDEARIVLLEYALIQSYYTISFSHDCLATDKCSYQYPDQTLHRLNMIKDLVVVPEGCPHSMRRPDCPNCQEVMAVLNKHEEAIKVLQS